MRQLEPLLGEWIIESPLMPGVTGRVVFEWTLGGAFLLERSEAPDPVPDSIWVIGPGSEPGRYVQHYFDSRGVARVYQMTFDGSRWELRRESPDFTPLDFAQRFVSELSADGNTIEGRWEIAHDRTSYELDFELIYRRIG